MKSIIPTWMELSFNPKFVQKKRVAHPAPAEASFSYRGNILIYSIVNFTCLLLLTKISFC